MVLVTTDIFGLWLFHFCLPPEVEGRRDPYKIQIMGGGMGYIFQHFHIENREKKPYRREEGGTM